MPVDLVPNPQQLLYPGDDAPYGGDPGSYQDPQYPSSPYPSDPYSPVTRTWVGGHDDHSATFADNWSPSGAPQPGDVLNFGQGSVDVKGYDLRGDTLYVGKPGEPSANTVNLSNQAQVSVDALQGSQPTVTFNVDGVAYADLHNQNPSNASYVFDLHAGASVQSEHVDLTGSNLYLNGGMAFVNTGEVDLKSSNLYVHSDLEGTGHVQVGDQKWPGSHAEVYKSVSSGQSFDVVGQGSTFSDLYVDDPSSFGGSVKLNDGYVVLGHVQADSYSLKNDLLDLYWKGNVVDSLHVSSGGDPLTVSTVGTGVLVDNSGYGSNGVALPVHVA
jgi:hypothetical protein